jgi:hypothetical protein
MPPGLNPSAFNGFVIRRFSSDEALYNGTSQNCIFKASEKELQPAAVRQRSNSLTSNTDIQWKYGRQFSERLIVTSELSESYATADNQIGGMKEFVSLKGASADSNFKIRRSTPPIQQLQSGTEVKKAVNDMIANISDGWGKFKSLPPKGHADREIQMKWKKRYKATLEMLQKLREQAQRAEDGGLWGCLKDGTVFGYFVNKRPIGLLAMQNESVPEIDILVTHPGSDGCGGILIERAVQVSQSWGSDGKLALYADNKNAEGAYRALGFVADSVNSPDYTLDPSKSNGWTLHQGNWRLKKYIDKSYIG